MNLSENAISREIVRCSIEVHKEIGGPGLLESAYEEPLAWELTQAGLDVKRQLLVPIVYKWHVLSTPLRLDLLVEDEVIVECKAVAQWNDVFQAQVLTYLRQTRKKLGMVVNFGDRFVKDGIHRVVNRL